MESPNTPPSNEAPKPPAPTGAPVAMPAPEPASAPASAAAPVKHKLNHSYVWLGALRIVPFVFVVAIASAGDALFELIDIYATGGSILIVLLVLIAIVLVATGIAMLVPAHPATTTSGTSIPTKSSASIRASSRRSALTFPISASNRSIRKQRCSSASRGFAP